MEPASPVLNPVQQAVPAVPGSPATYTPPPAPAPVPATNPVPVAAPGAVGAVIPQPIQQTPAGGTPGTPGVTAPAVHPAVTPSVQAAEFAQLQAEHQRVLAEIQRLTPYAAIGYRAQHGQTVAPATTAASAPATATAAPALGVPELDPNVSGWLTERDGQMVELPGAPPGTLAAYQRHQRDMANFIRSFAHDPTKVLGPVADKIRQDAIEEAKKQFANETKQLQDRATARSILAENAAWMYEKDASGNVVIDHDPLTGRQSQRLTEGGQWWMDAVKTLSEQGISDPAVLNSYAKSHAHLMAWQRHQQLQAAQAAATPPAPATPANPFGVPGVVPASPAPAPTLASLAMADPKMAFLAKVPGATPGQYNPPAAAMIAPPVAPRASINPVQDWKAQALQALYANGYNQNSRLPVGGMA